MEPKTINNSQIEDMLYFSLRQGIDFSTTSKEDFGVKIQEKLEQEYGLNPNLASRIMRPVFWLLSDNQYIPFDGSGKWYITEKARNLTIEELRNMAKAIINDKDIYSYLKSNFEKAEYKVN